MTPDDHRRAIEEIDSDIRRHKRAIRRLIGVRRYHASKLPQQPTLFSGSVHVVPHALAALTSAASLLASRLVAAEDVLRRAGKPLSAGDIAKAMLDQGYVPPNPASFRNSLHMALDRSPERFSKIRDGGRTYWRLREWENDPQQIQEAAGF